MFYLFVFCLYQKFGYPWGEMWAYKFMYRKWSSHACCLYCYGSQFSLYCYFICWACVRVCSNCLQILEFLFYCYLPGIFFFSFLCGKLCVFFCDCLQGLEGHRDRASELLPTAPLLGRLHGRGQLRRRRDPVRGVGRDWRRGHPPLPSRRGLTFVLCFVCVVIFLVLFGLINSFSALFFFVLGSLIHFVGFGFEWKRS